MRTNDNPSTTKLKEVKMASMYWLAWMCVKIKSSPIKAGVIGNPVKPKQAKKNTKVILGCS